MESPGAPGLVSYGIGSRREGAYTISEWVCRGTQRGIVRLGIVACRGEGKGRCEEERG